MKKQSVAILVSALILGFNASAADNKKQMMDPAMQEMMQKYEAAAKPGEQHKNLASMAGSWKTTSQMWEKPDAKPETAKGSANFKMILGGRWLQQEFKGTAMGKPFQGIGLVGYDNVKGKYESHWFDSMSTGSMEAEGDYDASTKTLKDKGSMSCPISATKTQDVRTEMQMVSKNKMIFSMYGSGPMGGPEFKMMEIVYTR